MQCCYSSQEAMSYCNWYSHALQHQVTTFFYSSSLVDCDLNCCLHALSDSSSTIGHPSTVNMLNDKFSTRDYLDYLDYLENYWSLYNDNIYNDCFCWTSTFMMQTCANIDGLIFDCVQRHSLNHDYYYTILQHIGLQAGYHAATKANTIIIQAPIFFQGITYHLTYS